MALIFDTTKHRPIKIIMRVDLLREMDQVLLDQTGGLEDRHELINEAVQQYLVDLRTGMAGEQPRHQVDDDSTDTGAAAEPKATPQPAPEVAAVPEVEPIIDLADTAIRRPAKPTILESNDAVVRREPLLGLHNADVPSIAALAHLAELTADGPIAAKTFYEKSTERARELAAALLPYERRHKVKLTALLPSNFAKAQAAARGYQAFALGHINKELRDDRKLDVWGPIYLWDAAALIRDNSETMIGITEAGWGLLGELDGLTFERPHRPDHARRFFAYLQRSAPEDLWGFRLLLDAVADGVGRVELNGRFLSERDWKETVATSVAQGYLARSREWALVAPKLVEGRYELTTFGREMRKALWGRDGNRASDSEDSQEQRATAPASARQLIEMEE